jgi:hypothetical protein
MSHFAQVINGIVQQVIVAEQDVINSGLFGPASEWVQTSYNTRGNIHYGQDGKPDGGVALRGNYAGIGHTYDATHDVFYPPSPFPSWTISAATNWIWAAPVPLPSDAGTGTPPKQYAWNETTKTWVAVTPKSA